MMKKWKKRTLILLVISVIISVAVAACIFLIPSSRKRLEKREKPGYVSRRQPAVQYNSDDVCNTEACVRAAGKMLSYMDRKVDPCVDFYNYSCGKFLSSYSIPDGWDSYGTGDIYNEELDVTVKSVLEQSAKNNESDSLTKAKAVYRTCKNVSHIEEYGIRDLKNVLSKTGVGDWPFLNPEWKDCRLDIDWRMAKMNSMGLDSLFHLETKFEDGNHKVFAVLSPTEPLVDGICDDDPDNITIVLERASEHRAVLESVLTLMGVDITNETELDIDDLFEFDFLFCNATKESREKAPVTDLKLLNTTVLQLGDMAPQINWMRWRNLVFTELQLDFPHHKKNIYFDGMESAVLGINNLLQKTTSKVLANYLSWRFVFQHLGFLGEDFRRIIERHSSIVLPKLGNFLMSSDRWIPRWRQCVIYVKNIMPLSLLLEYSHHIKMTSRENEMDSIISLVSDEFKLIMKDAKGLKKADQMRSSHQIALTQFPLTYSYKNINYFDAFYSDFSIVSDSFLKNGLKLRLIRMKKLLKEVSSDEKSYHMEYAIQTIYSAFGSETYFRGNQIVIPLGVLQSLSDINNPVPKYMTISTFGWRIGHEMAHGFDLLAVDGLSGYNSTWRPVSPSVSIYAKTKAECYLKYYSTKRDMTIEDAIKSTSLNEDLCDSQGIILAHRAYLRYLSQSYDDPLLPGLPLSNKELFFVSYAQQFCELRTPHNAGGSTSSGRRRVNQVLQNYDEFSTTFLCGRDKPMNPPKCESMWN